ncbi:glycoside hydrolase family 16 protein [Piloderma croceum F 1598]|uniref:Glycoside hydrolase family 16 protein n=1 Tax=Piloderma croceum (strain F 1598) TaxID=765440 RepID=A0A0C3FPD7_PILCF|nr:glycoside hydrolase family 16 protein [Piloderma croceum F 1598]
MKFAVCSLAVVLYSSFADLALAGTYLLGDNVVGSRFLDAFSFQAIGDPTYGTVNYVNESTAVSKGLVAYTSNSFTLRADDTTRLPGNCPGRDSVRIRSKKTYTTHVAIFDITHMPTGCGTWPAVWENGDPWPSKIDIVEGVNSHGTNQVSIHTSGGCTMPSSRSMTGTAGSNNCEGITGCGVILQEQNSFGPAFNDAGGGWYAMERTNNFINVWFWARNGGSVPADVKYSGSNIDTGNWGTPSANFPNTDCNLATHFGANYVVINIDLCGTWAGNQTVYAASGCPSTCDSFVRGTPAAFQNAYFEFASMVIYE